MVTEKSVDVPSMNAENRGTLQAAFGSQQPADWLASVPSARRSLSGSSAPPRRLAPGVPVAEHVQRLVVVKGEAACEPAADVERVDVAVLARDGRRHPVR